MGEVERTQGLAACGVVIAGGRRIAAGDLQRVSAGEAETVRLCESRGGDVMLRIALEVNGNRRILAVTNIGEAPLVIEELLPLIDAPEGAQTSGRRSGFTAGR